jgi:hypothetical protein
MFLLIPWQFGSFLRSLYSRNQEYNTKFHCREPKSLWTVCWLGWIQSISSHPAPLRSVLILSSHLLLSLLNSIIPWGFQLTFFSFISHVFYFCYIPRPFYRPLLTTVTIFSESTNYEAPNLQSHIFFWTQILFYIAGMAIRWAEVLSRACLYGQGVMTARRKRDNKYTYIGETHILCCIYSNLFRKKNT